MLTKKTYFNYLSWSVGHTPNEGRHIERTSSLSLSTIFDRVSYLAILLIPVPLEKLEIGFPAITLSNVASPLIQEPLNSS